MVTKNHERRNICGPAAANHVELSPGTEDCGWLESLHLVESLPSPMHALYSPFSEEKKQRDTAGMTKKEVGDLAKTRRHMETVIKQQPYSLFFYSFSFSIFYVPKKLELLWTLKLKSLEKEKKVAVGM